MYTVAVKGAENQIVLILHECMDFIDFFGLHSSFSEELHGKIVEGADHGHHNIVPNIITVSHDSIGRIGFLLIYIFLESDAVSEFAEALPTKSAFSCRMLIRFAISIQIISMQFVNRNQ